MSKTLKIIVAASALLALSSNAVASVELSEAEVQAWADEVMGTAFEQHSFSGAVITVVQDGSVILSRGYGFADYDRKTLVDPQRTGFRIGSVTKTFTATAIAQLLERGLIRSLDDPANIYLKRFQLPGSSGRDITLWDLLTHRAGFEDRFAGLGVLQDQPTQVSGEYIESVMPLLVRETGQWSVYDNFGVATLGVVIEDITGESYADYVEQNILRPLGMADTHVGVNMQPTPGLGRPYAAYPNGTFEPLPALGIHPFIAPTGAIDSTAADMARYMTAHLEGGQQGRQPILNAASFKVMHSVHAQNHPLFGGWGMVFPIRFWNTEKLVEHEGDWPGSRSKMTMLTESNIGVFISVMGGKGSIPIEENIRGLFTTTRSTPKPGFELEPFMDVSATMNDFLARFIGPYRPAEQVFSLTPLKEDLTRYVGSYMDNRTSFSTYEIIDAMARTLTVETDGNGGLSLFGMSGFKAISPGVFWLEGDVPALVGFIEDNNGMHLVIDGASRYFTRHSGFSNPANLLALVPICLLVALSGFLAAFWPAGSVAGHSRLSRIERVARWLPILALLCLVAMFVFLTFGFSPGDSLDIAIGTGRTGRFVGVILAANLLAVIAFVMALTAVAGWQSGFWGSGKRAIFRRVHFSLITIATLGLLPALAFANLLGFHLP